MLEAKADKVINDLFRQEQGAVRRDMISSIIAAFPQLKVGAGNLGGVG